MSNRVQKAQSALRDHAAIMGSAELTAIANGNVRFKDRTLVLATEVGTGNIEELLNLTTNSDAKRGINSFEKGVIAKLNAGGSVVVDMVKLSQTSGTTGDAPETKNYLQTSWPADLENAELEIKQGGNLLATLPIAEFCFKGDEPQTRFDQFLPLTAPVVLLADQIVEVILRRTEGGTGAIRFMKMEMKGLQTLPKRTN